MPLLLAIFPVATISLHSPAIYYIFAALALQADISLRRA